MTSSQSKVTKITRVVPRHQPHPKQSSNENENNNGRLLFIIGSLLPLLLLTILVPILYTLCVVNEKLLWPYMMQYEWGPNITNYKELESVECLQISTNRSRDLMMPDTNSITTRLEGTSLDDHVRRMTHHGMGLFPGMLTKETASVLRAYVLDQNEKLQDSEGIPVIEQRNRWSLGLKITDEPVLRAVHELVNRSEHLLLPILERLVGPNPAVVELSTITSASGARAQFYHADTDNEKSVINAANHFSTLYSILIPLQDTKPTMGATWVCPGTHQCHTEDFCEDHGFQLTTSADESMWYAGDALVYDSSMVHRGGAHKGGPPRAALIISVATRPRVMSSYQLPSGATYAIRWDHWGSCWNDYQNLKTAMETNQPLPRTLRALGLFQSPKSDRGWTYIDSSIQRAVNTDFFFEFEDLERFIENKVGFFGKLPSFLQGPIVEAPETVKPFPNYLFGVCRNFRNALAMAYTLYVVCLAFASREKAKTPIVISLCCLSISILLGTLLVSMQEPWMAPWHSTESSSSAQGRGEL